MTAAWRSPQWPNYTVLAYDADTDEDTDESQHEDQDLVVDPATSETDLPPSARAAVAVAENGEPVIALGEPPEAMMREEDIVETDPEFTGEETDPNALETDAEADLANSEPTPDLAALAAKIDALTATVARLERANQPAADSKLGWLVRQIRNR